ncbi:Alpha-tocopherol transfer protein-like [Eumeta japonica]|uniref:Alpha-tocopherol transfer protein-like n=1 Tax=Eumeta variegata TaxID=151549 RepID=A0A4C1VSD7_EUMVA|nr:Alpha-tocopherol transfer protein-like [Eumeta japonica]
MSVRRLDPALAQIARDELAEDSQRLEDDLRHIKEWLAKQPHLRARNDDRWLVAFLRGCKFSFERTKTKIDLYYTLRSTAADVTLRLKPGDPKFMEIVRLGTSLILPKSKDPLTPRVVLLRPTVYDPNKFHIADIICVFYYLVQILVIEDDTAQVIGVKTVVDTKGTAVAHLSQLTPALLKKIVVVTQVRTIEGITFKERSRPASGLAFEAIAGPGLESKPGPSGRLRQINVALM